MSDVFLFFVGCVVTLIVSGAVGLLLWGAAREPRGTLSSDNTGEAAPSGPRRRVVPSDHEPSRKVG